MSTPTIRQLLDKNQFIVAPGVFEMVSARIADRMDFHALYMTGYGTTASYLGLADAGLATYSDMVSRAGQIAGGTSKPLIADADTGYGGLLNVRHTVRGYEAAGVQGVQIEDQEMPKKCGHTPGRRVVPLADMLAKIEVAVDSRRSSDTLIVARTDARSALGLDEAIRRGKAFAAAGADVVFVESPESEDEFERVGQEIDAPLLANMVPGSGSRSPMIAADTLKSWGFNIAIYPGMGLSVAAEALRKAYMALLENGDARGLDDDMWQDGTLHELMGFEDIWSFEERWSQSANKEAAE
jgi:2,3-dimethylmalate lyase